MQRSRRYLIGLSIASLCIAIWHKHAYSEDTRFHGYGRFDPLSSEEHPTLGARVLSVDYQTIAPVKPRSFGQITLWATLNSAGYNDSVEVGYRGTCLMPDNPCLVGGAPGGPGVRRMTMVGETGTLVQNGVIKRQVWRMIDSGAVVTPGTPVAFVVVALDSQATRWWGGVSGFSGYNRWLASGVTELIHTPSDDHGPLFLTTGSEITDKGTTSGYPDVTIPLVRLRWHHYTEEYYLEHEWPHWGTSIDLNNGTYYNWYVEDVFSCTSTSSTEVDLCGS